MCLGRVACLGFGSLRSYAGCRDFAIYSTVMSNSLEMSPLSFSFCSCLFCRPSAGRLLPPVADRRHPLPLRNLPRGSRNVLPRQGAVPILDSNALSHPSRHPHLSFRRRVVATLRLELEALVVVVTHHPVVAGRALALRAEDPVQFGRARWKPVPCPTSAFSKTPLKTLFLSR